MRSSTDELRKEMVEGDGFEPSKAEPADLQSDPFGHSGTPPALSCAALVSVRKRVPFYGHAPTLASVFTNFFVICFTKGLYINSNQARSLLQSYSPITPHPAPQAAQPSMLHHRPRPTSAPPGPALAAPHPVIGSLWERRLRR